MLSPLLVVFCQRCDRKAGIGTVISLMLPYAGALTIVSTVFLLVWFEIGLPFGP